MYTSRFLESAAGGAEAVWLVGDVSYATGYLASWDIFLHMVSPWARSTPLAVGVGNHEAGAPGGASAANHFSLFDTTDSGGECGVVSTHLLPLPGAGTADAPWWAFSTGPFFLVTLSSEHAFGAGSAQLAWLEATLAGVDRAATPWLLLGVHRPMYIDSTYVSDGRTGKAGPDTGDQAVAAALRAAVEPLTMRYKVSALFYGHNHAVQRLSPAYRNASVGGSAAALRADGNATALFSRPRASAHFVIGTGGASFTKNCANCSAKAPLPPPPWSERVFYQYGAMRLTAVSATLLQLDWVSNFGSVVDRVDILQALELPWADEGGGGGGGGGASAAAIASAVGGAAGALAFAAGAVWWMGGLAGARKALCGAVRYAPVNVNRGLGAEKRPTYGATPAGFASRGDSAAGERELSTPLTSVRGHV